MEITLQAFAFVWGAIWGSFLNVVIHRLPQDLSVVWPGSRCGACQAPIRWYDNVPIFSYLILRGHCRACGETFSPRYMLVEATCGVLALSMLRGTVLPYDVDGFALDFTLWLWLQVFVYALVAITFIDLEHLYIPDVITYPGIVVGIAGAFLHPELDGWTQLYGALGGAGALLFVWALGWLLFRRDAMGFGDVKLLAMIGAFLGWEALPFVIFASSAQALVAAGGAVLWARLTGKKSDLVMTAAELDERFDETDRFEDAGGTHALPYGPFLGLAAVEALLFGGDLFWELSARLGYWIFGAAT